MGTKANASGDAALLRFLIQERSVDAEQARAAEQAAAADDSGKSALDFLAAKNVIDEEAVAQLLAARLHLTFVNPAGFAFDPSLVALLKEDVAARYLVVPLRLNGDTLTVASANPLDREALRAVEFATGKRVRAEVASLTAARDAVRHAYHLEESLDAYLQGVKVTGDTSIVPIDDTESDIGALADASDLPPVIKLLNLIIGEGIRTGASDIHIEPSPSVVQVRYRIDGLMEEASRLPKWVSAPLIARCKVMAELDITERRVPQDGRIGIRYRNAKIDLRVSCLPMQHGEKITMRILHSNAAQYGLEKLKFSARDHEVVKRSIQRPEGIVLVTGPTGSGKSTTLYAMINELATMTRNIVTIENPIEYQVRGVNQVEVNEKQGLTFAKTLRSILRQDPDVIMVGEIRDTETAEIALRAAQTGHLVLSTLHTNDTVATIARLVDLGIEPYMIAGALHMVVAQRLVRKICNACAEPYTPNENESKKLALAANGEYRRGKGCAACRNTGYSGRAAVVEVLEVTARMAKLIEARAPESGLRQQARFDGMLSLGECAAQKVRQGETTAEEALRVVDTISVGDLCPRCQAPVETGFKVCPHCLAPLKLECSKCDQPLQETWKVCPFCLTPSPLFAHLEPAPPLPAIPSPEPTPIEVQAESAPPVASDAAVTVGKEEERPYTALVVDDAADMRRLISVSLERSDLGVRVITAENGAEGLEKALVEMPDVILLDVMMPDMDGFEVCTRLRANMRTTFIPILMLTALDDLAHREKGFLAGTDDYISKPFNRQDLVVRVRRLLNRSYGNETQDFSMREGSASSAA